jgi:CPA2 family monovalent cation:H+ antiporter-2
MNNGFAEELLIVFALATLVLFIFQKARIPSIVGFLFTGALAGPNGFGLVSNSENIGMISELGVILLLFTIGVEFSLKTLLKIRRTVIIGGGLQVILTGIISFGIFRLNHFTINQSVFYGFLVALSSTAIAMRVLQERAEVDSTHGRTALGILVFQDLVAIPMLLIIPTLAGQNNMPEVSFLSVILKAVAIIALIIIGSRYLVPWMLHEIARTGNRELFLISIFLMVFAIAWFTSSLGLSIALGAFLAGLIISESDYSQQALGNIMPFRDLFTSFFFVSIGMMLNTHFLIEHPVLVAVVTISVLALKTFVSGFSAFLLGHSLKTQIMVGLSISQIGEFSFILASMGLKFGLFGNDIYQLFLDVAIFTMALTPLMVALAPRVQKRALRLNLPQKFIQGYSNQYEIPDVSPLENHIIIIGLGLNGQNLAHVARNSGIPYIIIDSGAEQVRRYKDLGEPVIYGDATSEIVMRSANIEKAAVAVVAISDAPATFRITRLARELNPSLHLIIRTRYTKDVEYLYMLGASDVIPEEFETSIEIFARVLNRYLLPRNEIDSFIADIRSGAYEMFRKVDTSPIKPVGISRFLPDLELSAIKVEKDSEAEGMKIADIKLRRRFGLTMVAMRRDHEVITDMNSSVILQEEDVVYLLGSKKQLSIASSLFVFQTE